jgi:hypothetical protein
LTRQQKSFGPELWAQGTRGAESALSGGAYIENMQTYRSGLLGPRPKWNLLWGPMDVTSGGLIAYNTAFPGRGVEVSTGLPVNSDLIVLTGLQGILGINSAGTTVWDTGTILSTNPSNYARLDTYTLYLGGIGGMGQYEFTTASLVVARPHVPVTTNSPISTEFGYSAWESARPDRGAIFWADRAWYWGTSHPDGTLGRMHYSDDHAFQTFSGTGTQYFDMDGQIEGATVIGKDMYVWTLDGVYYRFSTNGGPIEGLTITKAFEGSIPFNHGYQVLVDDVAFFMSNNGTQNTVIAQTSKGQDDESLRKLYPGNGDEYNGFAAQPPTGSSISNHVYIPYRGAASNAPLQGFVYYNGTWWNDTSLGFDTGTRNIVAGIGSDLDTHGNMWLAHYYENAGGTAWTMYVYTRDVCLERPSHVNDTWSTDDEEMYVDEVLTDLDVSGTVKMPRLAGANVNEYVRINAITIDAEYWKDATDTYPTVRIVVKVRDQEGNLSTVTTDLSAGGLADAAGGPLRINGYTPGLPFTPWCEIELTDIDSLALEFVHVDFEVEERKW